MILHLKERSFHGEGLIGLQLWPVELVILHEEEFVPGSEVEISEFGVLKKSHHNYNGKTIMIAMDMW